MPYDQNEAFARYAGFIILCALITVPFTGILGLAGVCVALIFLRYFVVDRLP